MDKVQRKLAAIKWTAPVWACAFSEFVSIISALDYMHLDLNTFHGNFPYRNPFNLRAHQRNLTEQFSLLVLFLSFFFIPPFGSINGGLSLCVYIYIYHRRGNEAIEAKKSIGVRLRIITNQQ